MDSNRFLGFLASGSGTMVVGSSNRQENHKVQPFPLPALNTPISPPIKRTSCMGYVSTKRLIV